MEYAEFTQKVRSKKYVLAHIESVRQFKVFNLESNETYSKQLEHFVIAIEENGIEYTKKDSLPLTYGQFYYNIEEKKVYLKTYNGQDPKKKTIFIKFRHFYSNFDTILPWDLQDGGEVHYDSLILDIGNLKLELDYENTGIAIESDSSIRLVSKGLIDIFDTHIWENQKAVFYSWTDGILPSNAKVIYRGFINNKSFNENSVTFNLRDQLTQLKKIFSFNSFNQFDGTIEQTLIGKPKRTIFGRAKQIRTTGVDKVLTGYNLSGLISGSADRNLLTGVVSGQAGTNIINGVGTSFLSEIEANQRIRIFYNLNEYSFNVDSVVSDNQLIVSSTIAVTFLDAEARNLDVLNNIIEGNGTDFYNEISKNDQIVVNVLGIDYKFTVLTINSPTELVINDNIDVSFTNIASKILPSINYRRKNRKWSVAGHELYEFNTQILEIQNLQTIKVTDLKDIEPNDFLFIDNQIYSVIRVSGGAITLSQSLPITAMIGDTVTKLPISRAYFGQNILLVKRDFDYVNNGEFYIELSPLAEFNIAQIKNPNISLQFVFGSRIVQSLDLAIDLNTIFKPRDWIRIIRADSPTYYEILEVSETQIKLVNVFNEANYNGQPQLKSPEYLGDNSLLVVDCVGMMKDNKWVRYPSDAIRVVLDDISAQNINEGSFDVAKEIGQYELSLFYPTSPAGQMPDCRKIITDINQSCFGSLTIDSNFDFNYSILSADKPEDLLPLLDDDIIDYSITTRNQIISDIELEYLPFTDTLTSSDSVFSVKLSSDFVERTSKIENTFRTKAFLFNESDAKIIASRWLFFRSATQTVVSVRGKLNLADKALNEKMFLKLSGIYRRYGSLNQSKIGIINYVSKDESNVEIRFNDLGNIFNRVGAIAPDVVTDYVVSSDDDIAKYAFIVDNDTETPDSSDENLGNNLIG